MSLLFNKESKPQPTKHRGSGSLLFSEPQARAESSSSIIEPSATPQTTPITPNRKYDHSDSWLGRTLESFDWLANASRSGLSAAINDQDTTESVKQGLSKDRSTTATQLKDDVTKKLFGGTVRFGKDDGEFQIGDVADFAIDLGVDIATDPLTYVPVVGQAAKVAGLGGKLAKGISAVNAMDKVVAPAALGAVYGAGSAEKDDDAGDILTRGLAGAVAGVGLRNSGKALKPLLYGDDLAKGVEGKNGLFDEISDKLASWSGKVEPGTKVGRASRIADEAFDKFQRKAASIFFKRNNAIGLDDLTDAEKWELDGVLKQLKDGTAEYRQQKFSKLNGDPDQKTFNQITKEANEYAEKELFPRIMKDRSDKITNAVTGMAKHNEDLVKEYNQFKFGIDEATDEGVGLVGLKYHTDDIKYTVADKDKEALDRIFNKSKFTGAEVKEFKNASSDKFKSVREAGVGPDERYAEYSRKFAQNFLDDKEKEALNIMFDYTNKPAREGLAATLENGGMVYDKMNNWVKKNLLFASLTWVKNNFWDNLAKSYVENGLGNAMGTAKTQIPGLSKINKDLMEIYKGNIDNVLPTKQYNQMMIEAIEDGATDGPMMRSIIGNALQDALKVGDTPQTLARGTGTLLDKTLSLADKWSTGLEKVTGTIGSGMEGAARFTLYKNLREQMAKKGVPEAVARQNATKMVQDTFFNYNELTKFERDFAKRLMPFYSFYSKNLPYWVQTGLDPDKAKRLFRLQKIPNNVGEKPSERDQRGIPEHLQKHNARILSKGKDGKIMGYMPTMSIYDAINMSNLGTVGDQFVEKLSPLIKAPLEGLPHGHDYFLDQPTYPSDRMDGQRPLFSSGYKYLPGLNPWVYTSSKGSPMTDSDALTAIDKWSSNLQVPIVGSPITGQIAGSIGNMKSGRKSPGQAISELLSPVKSTLLTPEQEGKNIRYKAESSAKELKQKAKDEKRARERRRRSK